MNKFPFAWKVSHNRRESYLLGTSHKPYGPEVVTAGTELVDKVDCLLVEGNKHNLIEEPSIVSPRPMLDVLDTKRYNELHALLHSLLCNHSKRDINETVTYLERLHLWAIPLIISTYQAEAQKSNARKREVVLDEVLKNHGERQGKDIITLDDTSKYCKIMSDLTIGAQYALFVSTLQHKSQDDEKAEADSYLDGDLSKLANLFQGEVESEYKRVVLEGRNKSWMKKINDEMKKRSVAVVVGAAHMVGKNGLVNLLRGKGKKVERIEYVRT